MSVSADFRSEEEQNRRRWDESAPIHLSAYREVAMLRAGDEILDEIELREVGEVRGQSLLHLQCHIGTDSLAWARRGAQVTGVDFSPESIACAEALRDELGLEARFLCANLYDLGERLDETFDIVYTSRGVLCWLKDLTTWGAIIARALKPVGLFYLMESHPILNALEENAEGRPEPARSYFHENLPARWDGDADYADAEYTLLNASFEWTWSIADILGALRRAGLEIELVNEYDRIFFKALPSMTSDDGRWYRLPGALHRRLPLLLTVRARRPRT